jgi:hypothetical protein
MEENVLNPNGPKRQTPHIRISVAFFRHSLLFSVCNRDNALAGCIHTSGIYLPMKFMGNLHSGTSSHSP